MQYKIAHLFLFGLCFSALAQAPSPYKGLKSLPLSERIQEGIAEGNFFAKTNVDDFKANNLPRQKMDFVISGLHPRNCRYALRKLSQYEQYQKYIGFVKESSYDNKLQKIRLYMSSPLLPFNMILRFKIPRIKKAGRYPFEFDEGFLKGLTGDIHAIEEGQKCLFYTTANWQGPDTGISNFVFEFFTSTLAKISMDNLFRISGGK